MKQDQFLDVKEREEAIRLWLDALGDPPEREIEEIPLSDALGRTLGCDIKAPGDVPGFDRSNMDGFAVQARDTWGASEQDPIILISTGEEIPAGVFPTTIIEKGHASTIATGAMVPRGADAVVMVEHTDQDGDQLVIRKPVVPGQHITFAGTDISKGETIVRAGTYLTARETGILAACGVSKIPCQKPPHVSVLSTGNEIVPPGIPLRPGQLHDANARAVGDALRELGMRPDIGEPLADDEDLLRFALKNAVAVSDIVILSGGTSKGEGDLCTSILDEFDPGIIVHGVAVKPGKPICLAVANGTPVVVLPGFPTSALFTFHDIVVPALQEWIGLPRNPQATVEAQLATSVSSVRGRREYVLVGLIESDDDLTAYPMGKGSGSITTWSHADGYFAVPTLDERRDEGERVRVHLLGEGIKPADLVIIGSHCVGLDVILNHLNKRGIRSRVLAVGSKAGLEAAKKGGCDLAPAHLLDEKSGAYNEPFLEDGIELIPGYRRSQAVIFRPDDPALKDAARAEGAVGRALAEESYRMVNRQQGSGTRIVIDGLLGEARPAGYSVEARNHNAVAAAIQQKRADWGVAIGTVAKEYGLVSLSIKEELFDFFVPTDRRDRGAVQAFCELLQDSSVQEELKQLGFQTR